MKEVIHENNNYFNNMKTNLFIFVIFQMPDRLSAFSFIIRHLSGPHSQVWSFYVYFLFIWGGGPGSYITLDSQQERCMSDYTK